ncbi:T9SS type A sorting domain-containing protein [Aureisphaera galaxeae]|uniref:T9SS type A sorting domain-containing protein n=1 Tax=Aureisphaera galaxeae TaxID=1538023 RepID=UPI00234FE7AC|nr:T9SS type A sorting domain-containing protein [Aureisphaera galaxeae]MDC8003167.1 T9SS type A sorting domain-containing protein [Aureisphaera galaxeae]
MKTLLLAIAMLAPMFLEAQNSEAGILSTIQELYDEIDNEKVNNSEVDIAPILLDEIVITGYAMQICTVRYSCSSLLIECNETSEEESTEEEVSTEEVDELENHFSGTSKVRVFPNPSSGVFHLKLLPNYKKVSVNIHNVLGQQVHAFESRNFDSQVPIDLSAQPAGIYLANVVADGKRLKTHKLIKQ